MKRTFFTFVLAGLAFAAVPTAQGQRGAPPPPPTAETVLETARKGNPQEAWTLWNRLPAGPEKQRLGIRLAAETRQIPRGLDLYDQMTSAGQNVDLPMLSLLALGTAAELSQSTDVEIRATACTAALVVDPSHEPCLRALEAMADPASSADVRATAVAALANADVSGYRQQLRGLTLRAPLRLRFAQTMTRLSSADRFALVQPLLSDADVARQYEVILALANIPGAEALGALQALPATGPMRQARTVALARHGDAASLGALPGMLANMDGYLKIQAARALADAADIRGRQTLVAMGSGPVDLDRVYAAEALASSDPTTARTIIFASLEGSAAVKPAAIYVAGLTGIGADRRIYRQMVGESPATRAAAVAAVLETVSNGGRPRAPRLP